MRVRPFDEQVSPRCASPVLLCAVCRDRAPLGVRCLQCTCTYRCRHVQHVQMRKDTSTTVSLAPAEPWAGSGPGQVTSQATRRALTCGSRADRPGTDASVSDARCCCCSLLLPARGRAFVRSFVPRVMEGGDTNCYLLIGGGGSWAPRDVTVRRPVAGHKELMQAFLSRAVLVGDRFFLLFCFSHPTAAGPNKWTEVVGGKR